MKQDNYNKDKIEIIQSYIITTARYDFSVHEKRILYRLVEMIQFQLAGKKLNQRYRVEKELFQLYEVEIPLKAFLQDEKDTHHSRAKEALTSLAKKLIQYEDEKEWRAIPIIVLPRIKKHEGTCTFKLHEDIYNVLLNFTKGFKKYELKTAMTFESTYAMRLYELLSKQRTPLIFSIKELKAMFGVEKKYKLTADFIKRVIDSAKKELDEKSPYSFEYSSLKTGRQITSLKLFPVHIRKNEDPEVFHKEMMKRHATPSTFMETIVKNYLRDNFNFSNHELKNNMELFIQAQKEIPDLLLFLSEIKGGANRAGNPKGYVINALKKRMKIDKKK